MVHGFVEEPAQFAPFVIETTPSTTMTIRILPTLRFHEHIPDSVDEIQISLSRSRAKRQCEICNLEVKTVNCGLYVRVSQRSDFSCLRLWSFDNRPTTYLSYLSIGLLSSEKYCEFFGSTRTIDILSAAMREGIIGYGLTPKSMEKKKAVRYEASWDPKLEIRIWEDKADSEALEALEHDQTRWKIFTDGSGYKKHVGAAAVLFEEEVERGALRYRLGKEEYHEVYEGECIGVCRVLCTSRA
ncbi:hypothetical protein F5878DRAFT_448686 [Lentinula raphanica]|uniref:Uncharacterized protein n=1 Tax=Lentinula raphanica TaxID=153919 RepID=A0AA38UHL0_9AGAR|nr:hypothetical protein F5878DRAFT_448686 [Lentinula raphanica]